MRFREVLRFEVDHQLRQRSTWLYVLLLLGSTVAFVAGGGNPVGTGTLINGPVKTATFTFFLGLFGALITAGIFVEAASRDLRWRMDSLFHTSPLRKIEYLGGRFFGALLVNAALLLAIPLGLIAGSMLPSVKPDALGLYHLGTYLVPYVTLLLPNLLLNAALLYGITLLTRRSLPGYLAALGLVAMYLVALNGTVGLEGPGITAVVDPTGAVALASLTRGWSRVELDTRSLGLSGALLWNRLLWIVISMAMLVYTYRRYRATHVRGVARKAPDDGANTATDAVPLPSLSRVFRTRTRWKQALAVARMGFRQIVMSRELLLTLVGLFILAIVMGGDSLTDSLLGTELWPLTPKVASILTGRFIDIIVTLLITFCAGELIWKERDAGIEQIADSAPIPNWPLLVGKVLTLTMLLVVVQAALMTAGVVMQAVRGYTVFQPGLYVRILFGLQLADYLLFAALALVVHVIVNQKYLAHVVVILIYLAIMQAGRVGIEHNLLIYGSDPGWIYTDMTGFGPFVAGVTWFKLYWFGWALMFGIVASVLWVRGAEQGIRSRLRRVHLGVATFGGAGLLIIGTGGFVFYNTNSRNEYRTSWNADEREAEYERRYKRFEGIPQPWLTGVALEVEVYPERRSIAVQGRYRLVNRTSQAIDSIHLSSFTYPELRLRRVEADRAGTVVLEDAARGYRIYALERPLLPGDSLELRFDVGLTARGFKNRQRTVISEALVDNGLYLEMWRVLPAIGYQRELMELTGDATRRAHGLAPRKYFRNIDDTAGRQSPRSGPHADWIDFEATVSTAHDQTALLPGTLEHTWTANGRRYFHYSSDARIMHSIGLMSARYAVYEDHWNGVPMRVLHHPSHSFNTRRMVRGVEAALDYYSKEFGPYPHREFTLVEIPGYRNFGRAMPAGFMYTESNLLAVGRLSDSASLDLDASILMLAHEAAHLWWGHQVIAADVEGSQVLSETLAQYSALMVLERSQGDAAAHSFVRSMHLAYLDGRGTHAGPEVPLFRSSDQEYLHYRKGAVVMYALRDYLGEDRVNAALRSMLAKYGAQGAPYPTTLDLYRELGAVTPDSLRYLLDDLLTTITSWDLRTAAARAEPTSGGAYRVTLEVEAAKIRSDSAGNDTVVPMNDLVEVGVFAEAPGTRLGKTLYLGKHRLRAGRQTIVITVPGTPGRAGVDPYHELISRRSDAVIQLDVKVPRVASQTP